MDHLRHVEARALGEVETFGQGLAEAHDTDLIRHLRDLAGSRFTHQSDARRVRRDHGFDVVERSLIAARHHGECSLASSVDPTRHRCVEERSADRGHTRGNSARGLRRGGGVIDPHAPSGDGRRDLIGDREQFTIGWQRRDHDVGVTRRIGWRRGRSTAHFGREPIGHSGHGIAHRDAMFFGHEMGRDVPSHATDSDHGNRATHAGTPGWPRSASVNPPAKRA